MNHTAALVFAVTVATYAVAHQAADFWVQTHHQSGTKGAHGWAGSWSCFKHVLTYTATLAACLALMAWVLDIPISTGHAAAGLAINAATHYFADRRTPLETLARFVGKGDFWDVGKGTMASGAFHLDQSWHWAWLGAAALITATGSL